MIAMSSARSASVLSAVKPKQTRVTAATLILPLANLDLMAGMGNWGPAVRIRPTASFSQACT